VTLVKICGMTRADDVRAAADAGADLVGLILVEGSPRALDEAAAERLLAAVPDGVEAVGVFTDPARARRAASLPFARIQLYGPTDGVRDALFATRGDVPADLPAEAPVLLDMPFGSRPGRADLRAHWHRAAGLGRPVMLAGSLDPENVAEAVAVARPWAVDTARGVESSPGVKDHALVRRFVAAAKGAP
jgi:phosphoribosylanthranilate isomerase